MDESFAVELPPASQLDSSVLEALPASLRERILNGYARKQQLIPPSSSDFSALNFEIPSPQPIATFNPTHPLPELKAIRPPRVVSVGTSEMTQPCRELTFGLLNSKPKGVLIGDEFKFFSEHRTYLKDWVINFLDGPDDSDLQTVTVYLTDLVRGNLEATTVILKYFRRLILNLNLCQWYPVFNSLLQRLQTETHHQYGGMLNVKEIL